jgi:GR25 family glycosyltransferase involved in LPS biosynthesis
MTSHIDVVYYINLDHRHDRKIEFLREMDKYDFKNVIRVPGIYEQNRGHLGCSKSHIKVLEMFIQSPHKNCIICEDDFEFTCNPSSALHQLFHSKIDFDVCMASGNSLDARPVDGHDFIKKAHFINTSSCYIITKKFAPVLLQNFRDSCKILEKSYNESTPEKPYEHYASLDQHWCTLQPQSKWYIFEPKLGKQRKSYSDIDQQVKDMNL